MASKSDIELLKQEQKLLEEQIARINELDEKEALLAANRRKRLIQARNHHAQMELAEKRLADARDQYELKKTKDNLANIKQQELEIERIKELAEHYEKNAEKIDGLIEKSAKLKQKAGDVARKSAIDGQKSLEDQSKKVIGEVDMSSQALVNSLEGAFEGVGGVISAWSDSPAMILGSITGQLPGISMFKQALLKMPEEMDTAFSGVIKATNVNSIMAKESMTAMIDPLYAARKDGAFRNLAEDSQLLGSIGMNAEDAGEAMQGLLKDVAMFRPSFIESNKAQAAFIGNLVAGLKKVGVPIEISTKNLNRFTKAMKMTPKEAANSLKSLGTVAKSLGL